MKTTKLAALICAGIAMMFMVVAVPVHAEYSEDMLAYWDMEDNWNDDSTAGADHDGTGYGSVGFTTGVFGQAGDFDLASTDKVEVGDHADFTFGANEFTISMYFYGNIISPPSTPDILNHHYDPSGSSKRGWATRITNPMGSSEQYFRYAIQGDDDENNIEATANTLTHSTWYHLVWVRDNTSTDTLRFYVDGVAAGTDTTIDGEAIQDTDEPVRMGVYRTSGAWHYTTMYLDDCAIFNTALATASDTANIEALADFGVHLFGGVDGGINNVVGNQGLDLSYTSQNIYDLAELYSTQGTPVVIGADTWYYTSEEFGGRDYGEGWTDTGEHYVNLGGSGITTLNPIPEPMSVIGFLMGIGVAIKRRFRS